MASIFLSKGRYVKKQKEVLIVFFLFFVFVLYFSEPVIVTRRLGVELAALRERSTPGRLGLKEGLGERETRPPRCVVVVLPAGATVALLGVRLGTAVSD